MPSLFILTIIQPAPKATPKVRKQTFETQTFEYKQIKCYKNVEREKTESVHVGGIMATRHLRSYLFWGAKVKAAGNVTAANASVVNAELESLRNKKGRRGSSYSTNIPSRVKEEVGKYACSCGTQAAINCLKPKYPHDTFVRTTINNWKRNFDNQKGHLSSPFNKHGQPNTVGDELLQKLNEVVIGVRYQKS